MARVVGYWIFTGTGKQEWVETRAADLISKDPRDLIPSVMLKSLTTVPQTA